ncbi:methyltransferase [Verrucomicrobiaceae bacterium SCGC AG-212-N21]|nr:methyltransferase [Verrucomicrobiaceae bacterium SCGC AG-212-N21]
MNDPRWTGVDNYISDALFPPDPTLAAALEDSVAANLPAIQVTPALGRLLHLLAKNGGARNILEIGTLGGYSTIWLARALPSDGRLISLELEPGHAAVAQRNLSRAGLAEMVEVRCGAAIDLLPRIAAEGLPPFDFTFIDADKALCADYFAWALKLSRVGSVIIVDNVVRDGAVADAGSEDANVLGVRRLHDMLRTDTRVCATTIQTVGSKGYDGFTMALVTAK